DAIPLAHIVVDQAGILVHASALARTMFGIHTKDLGRPFQDLEISYRPVELRGSMDIAHQEHHTVTLKDVEWLKSSGQPRFLEVRIAPVYDPGGASIGTSITYEDVTRYRQLQEEVRRSGQELETAMEELQSTNEELETTNEELQSTVEELETTNEE